jgi:hypothetical protein
VANGSTARTDRPRTTALAAGAVMVVAYAAVAGHFTTFTRPAEVATFVPGLIGVIVAVRRQPRSRRRADRSGRGWLAWWLLVIGVNVIEFTSLFLGANRAHPTVSDLVNPWLLSTPSRAVAFGLWLCLGYWLTRR